MTVLIDDSSGYKPRKKLSSEDTVTVCSDICFHAQNFNLNFSSIDYRSTAFIVSTILCSNTSAGESGMDYAVSLDKLQEGVHKYEDWVSFFESIVSDFNDKR